MRDFSAALVHGSNETAHAFASLKLYDKFHEKMLNE